MCRFWGYAAKVYIKNKKHIPYDQCYDILVDTINYVLEKRAWEDPDSSLYGDYSAPDKAFHVVLKRQQGIVLASLSTGKRKSNFNTVSIDELHELYFDAAEGLFGIDNLHDESSENTSRLISFIKDSPVEQIPILDMICFSNWSTLNQVVSKIKNLNENNYNYYKLVYNLDKNDYNNIVNSYKEKSNKKLLFDTKRFLYSIRNEV